MTRYSEEGVMMKTVATETDKRESETQTVPYTPLYSVHDANRSFKDVELVDLQFKTFETYNDDNELDFAKRLGITRRDLQLFERCRAKRMIRQELGKLPETALETRRELLVKLEKLELQCKEEDTNLRIRKELEEFNTKLSAEKAADERRRLTRCMDVYEENAEKLASKLTGLKVAEQKQLEKLNAAHHQLVSLYKPVKLFHLSESMKELIGFSEDKQEVEEGEDSFQDALRSSRLTDSHPWKGKRALVDEVERDITAKLETIPLDQVEPLLLQSSNGHLHFKARGLRRLWDDVQLSAKLSDI